MRKRALRLTLGAVAGLGAIALFPTIANAQEPDPVTVLGQQVNLLWVVIGAILVIFMQAGFALVETGFCRAKHAAHVVSTNFAIFGLGFIGFFFIGFPLAFGGFSTSLIGLDSPVGEPLLGSGNWVFLFQGGWALSTGTITPALLGLFLYMVAFMDTVATIPTGSMAERWKWGSFVIWGLFCGAIYYPLFAAWTWGGGWLAKTWDTMNLGAGYIGLRRFRRRARGRWRSCPRRCTRARSTHRQVRRRRNPEGDPRSPHPDGPARHVHPAVRLVRLQRRVDLRRHRRPVRHGRDEHRDRRCLRRHHRHAVDHQAHRQARPRHDGQRHARRPRGDHRAVRVRRSVGGGRHRMHRRRPRHRVGVLRRAQAQGRRPGGRDLGPRRVRLVRRARRRHLLQRQLRRRLERFAERRGRRHHQGRLGPARRPGARRSR